MNTRVKAVRNNLGLTLEKFGERVGLTKSAMSNIENGNRSVTNQVVSSICREFGVNESWLRTGDGEMFSPLSDDDRYSINLGKLTLAENDFVKNAINYLAETDPAKLKVIEEFMKACLGIK